MEKSKRSEATLTVRMNHDDDHGMNGDSNLSQTVCVHLNKENSQGTMTLTTRKRDYRNKQAELWFNPQRSRVTGSSCFHFIAHVVVLVALYFMSPIQLLSMHRIYSLSDLYGNSLQQTAVNSERSNCNKINLKNLESRTSEVFIQRRQTTGSLRSIMSPCTYAHLWTFFDLS